MRLKPGIEIVLGLPASGSDSPPVKAHISRMLRALIPCGIGGEMSYPEQR